MEQPELIFGLQLQNFGFKFLNAHDDNLSNS
jgi:hypothetical protein